MDNESDSFVILGESNHSKVVKWRFPNTSKCPIKSCKNNYETKALALKHFQREHAPDAVLCQICDKPVYTKSFREHTREHLIMHPYPAADDDNYEPPEKKKVVSCVILLFFVSFVN